MGSESSRSDRVVIFLGTVLSSRGILKMCRLFVVKAFNCVTCTLVHTFQGCAGLDSLEAICLQNVTHLETECFQTVNFHAHPFLQCICLGTQLPLWHTCHPTESDEGVLPWISETSGTPKKKGGGTIQSNIADVGCKDR